MKIPRPLLHSVSILILLASIPLLCQDQSSASPASMDSASMHNMHGMDNAMDEMKQQMHPKTFLQEIKHHATSGTSAEPNSTPVPMLMTMKGKWMLMFHANAFLLDTQQSSPRGGNKFYSTNWFMPMAERPLGPGPAARDGLRQR